MPKNKMMRLTLRRTLLVVLLLTLAILAAGAHPAEAARRKRHNPHHSVIQTDRFAEIVIESSTGRILSERNADKILYPASLSKLMTLYLAFEELDNGRLSKNQRVAISRRAAHQPPSSLELSAGDTIRIEDLILGIATKSANDAAVVLAEAIGGSEDHFARTMTAKAHQLGMNNTHFVNASGLFNRQQYSTARDIATLAQALLRDYPGYYHYFSTSSFTYNGNIYINHNKLMASYPGMDGLKTGYVYASGYNLAASAVHNGVRLIGVIFGGRTPRSRNAAMAKLLNQSFASAGNLRVAALATKEQKKTVPLRRPSDLPASAETTDSPAPAQELAAAQLPIPGNGGTVMDQGDTDIAEDASSLAPASGKTAAAPPTAAPLAENISSATQNGGWAIQIGAFASHEASVKALQSSKAALPKNLIGADTIAPLMTSRGVIYRARLSGLARDSAAAACRILKGNCLILAVE